MDTNKRRPSHHSEGKSLIWTLNQDLNPIYAIEPVGGFSADVYETLQLILAGQIEAEDSEEYIERVSIPAKLTNRSETAINSSVAVDSVVDKF